VNRVDDNIAFAEDGGQVCSHCGGVLAAVGEPHLHRALIRVGEVSLAGPHVRAADPPVVDEEVQFRQLLCPSCGTALLTEIAATADRDTRTASVTARTSRG